MTMNPQRPSYFDVPYAVASSRITAATTVIATVAADYYGFAIIISSAPATLMVYNSSTALGAIIDVRTVTSSTQIKSDVAIKARKGLTAVLTGADAYATIFYSPKG